MVTAASQSFGQFAGSVQATQEATTFLDLLETAPDSAYDRTTADYKKATSREQFTKLLKDNPVLTAENYHTQGSLPTPTGAAPNRKVTATYTVIAGVDPNPPGTTTTVGTSKATGTATKPTTPPTTPATTSKPKSVTVTLTLVEQAGGDWKVDGFTVQ
jgi:hypothetical protein